MSIILLYDKQVSAASELSSVKPLSAQTIAQGPLVRMGGGGAEIGFTVDVSQVGYVVKSHAAVVEISSTATALNL